MKPFLIIAAALLAGCVTTTTVRLPDCQSVTLRAGQTCDVRPIRRKIAEAPTPEPTCPPEEDVA